MSESKLQFKVGIVEFSGEGNQDWLSAQLDKILVSVPELLKIDIPATLNEPDSNHKGNEVNSTNKINKPTNLPTFLREKGATVKQVRKFLATAAFIQLNGKNRMTTADVASLLSQNNQTKINNPADTLNQNVSKGHCSKEGNSFYVTPEGFQELSIKPE
jgi:hypothetical protein